MLVKPCLTKKENSLYHELVSELLLHDKEEFRMVLRMNTMTYEVNKFVVISRYSAALNLVERFVAWFWLQNIEVGSPHQYHIQTFFGPTVFSKLVYSMGITVVWKKEKSYEQAMFNIQCLWIGIFVFWKYFCFWSIRRLNSFNFY